MHATYVLSVLTHVVLLPPFSLFLALGAGLLVRRWRPRLGNGIAIFALILLFVLCTNAGARLLVRPLEDLTTPLKPGAATAAGAQAIVVLAAGAMEHAPEYGGADIPDNIALARLRYGARLQHETGLPLLVSGGNARPEDGVEAKALAMARALRDDFRTPVKWIEPRSETTAENATYSAAMLKADGVRRVLLVTDAMHMARAQRAFEQAGLDVIAAPTMFYAYGRLMPMHFLPSAGGLQSSYYAVYEWTGLAWYRLRE